jgi:hypothetical protein
MNTLPDLELPQISMNGTDVSALVEQQAAIILALAQVTRRMAAARPHGRDYQYRRAEFPRAQAAWQARERLIEELQKELVEHALAIQKAEG